jgi:hypothetical protein
MFSKQYLTNKPVAPDQYDSLVLIDSYGEKEKPCKHAWCDEDCLSMYRRSGSRSPYKQIEHAFKYP